MNFEEIKELDQKYIMNTYNRYPVAIDHGEGATLYDTEGRKYIDFTSGIGVNTLGYGCKGWENAVTEQVKKLSHISNLYYTEPDVKVAEKLCEKSGMKKVFFCNSGAEANEGMIKMARKYSKDKYGEGRHTIITLKNSFHGRTITTLNATGQDCFHTDFQPLTEGFRYAEANDISYLIEQDGDDVCAVMVELIQGEGGVNPLDKKYVEMVRSYCEKRDLLFLVDEVQTGIGRTGSLFAFQQYEIEPDAVSFAKGIAGGLPMGGFLANDKLKDVLTPGTHGSTFGGNPVSCAAASYVLDSLDEKLFTEIKAKGDYIKQYIVATCSDTVESVKGAGLMIGIKLKYLKNTDVAASLCSRGLLTLTAGGNVLRLLPPLTISIEELEEGLKILTGLIGD